MRIGIFVLLLLVIPFSLVAFGRLFVGNERECTFVDFHLGKNRSIDMSMQGVLPIENTVSDVLVSPDWLQVYAILKGSEKFIQVDFSGARPLVKESIDLGCIPSMIAFKPDKTGIYALSKDSQRIIFIEKTPLSLLLHDPIELEGMPTDLALSPDGKWIFLCLQKIKADKDELVGEIACLDAMTGQVIQSTPLSSLLPFHLNIDPSGKRGYVLATDDKQESTLVFLSLDLSSPIPRVENSTTLEGTHKARFLLSQDGKRGYLSDGMSQKILVFDIAKDRVQQVNALEIDNFPRSLALSPDGSILFVALRGGEGLQAYDLEHEERIRYTSLSFESPIRALVVAPDQGPVASCSFRKRNKRLEAHFSAVGSFSPTGKIAEYRWDFGDTSCCITRTPYVTHRYCKEGSYRVSLTVTNTSGTSKDSYFNGKFFLRSGSVEAEKIVSLTLGSVVK